MTPQEFRDIRNQAGLSQDELARWLGFYGRSVVSRIETQTTSISGPVRRLMLLLHEHGRKILGEKGKRLVDIL